jgi:hypothetical protein
VAPWGEEARTALGSTLGVIGKSSHARRTRRTIGGRVSEGNIAWRGTGHALGSTVTWGERACWADLACVTEKRTVVGVR